MKKIIHKDNPVVPEPEEERLIGKTRDILIRLPDALNVRFTKQCKRLYTGVGVAARMAIVKFVEEEEAKQKALKEATIKL